jgi:hypothetical protein
MQLTTTSGYLMAARLTVKSQTRSTSTTASSATKTLWEILILKKTHLLLPLAPRTPPLTTSMYRRLLSLNWNFVCAISTPHPIWLIILSQGDPATPKAMRILHITHT